MKNYYHKSKKLLNNLFNWVEKLENVSLREQNFKIKIFLTSIKIKSY